MSRRFIKNALILITAAVVFTVGFSGYQNTVQAYDVIVAGTVVAMYQLMSVTWSGIHNEEK